MYIYIYIFMAKLSTDMPPADALHSCVKHVLAGREVGGGGEHE